MKPSGSKRVPGGKAKKEVPVHCLFNKLVAVDALKPHPKNRNAHPTEQIERLARILKYQGWRYPVKVSTRSGFVTSGHGRIEAAKLNGWDSVPVNYQPYDSDAQEYADVQADNAIASWSELNLKDINLDLKDLGKDFDTELLGIKNFEILNPDAAKCDEDEVPALAKPKVKRGDLFFLGDHRLLCGDSTQISDVDKLVGQSLIDMAFVDPPYNLGFKYKTYSDDKTEKEYSDFCRAWFGCLSAHTKKIIITPGTKNIFMWASISPDIEGIACWVKKNWISSCKISKLQQWEPILFYGKFENKRVSDLYEISRVVQKDVGGDHPCPKQVELISDILENYSKGAVLDTFGGSGTTMIACEKLGRKNFSMEIDPSYCGVILDRWEKYTGKKAKHENGKSWEKIKNG